MSTQRQHDHDHANDDCASLPPDEQRRRFLTTVMGVGLPDGMWAHLWRPAPRHTDWIRSASQAEQSIANRGDTDVYISVGLAGSKGGPFERVSVNATVGLLGVVADIDVAGEAHKQADLPATQEEALAFLDELDMPATLTVASGHGVQAWWLFTEPWRFKDDTDQRLAVRLSATWQDYLHGMARAHGWTLDSVGDLSRIVRLPGTCNAKQRTAIVPVRLLTCRPHTRYTPTQVSQHTPGIAAYPRQASNDAVMDGQRFTADKPCPVCNGYEELAQGMGERCWGFLGRAGDVAFCTREEYAGALDPRKTSMDSTVYVHQLWGPCDCGVTHRASQGNGDGPVPGRAVWSATQFLERYGDRLRYISETRRWLECNGKWWDEDKIEVVNHLGYVLARELYGQAAAEDDRQRKRELAELAFKLDDDTKIRRMIAGARAHPPIAARVEQFDTDDWKLQADNGIIDLATGDLLPHDPAAMHSRRLGPPDDPLPYLPDAQCPRWLAHLCCVFPEHDQTDMIRFAQRMYGYSLTGSIREQCMFILTGNGANGKTTFTQPLVDLLGSYHAGLQTETLLASAHDRNSADLAKLLGARCAFASENERKRALAEALIKQLTGGEEITARMLYQNPITFTPKFKLWLQTNHKPRIKGQDHAIWRRLRVIPFTHTLTDAEKIPDFYTSHLKAELPGILAWAVQGCLDWQRDGFGPLPDRMRQALADYKEENDTITEFLGASVYPQASFFLPTADVFREYCRWCTQQGEKPESHNALSRAIVAQFSVEPAKGREGERGFAGLSMWTERTY